MKRISLSVGVILGVIFLAGNVFGGYKLTREVSVSDYAISGDVGAVRNSTDSNQMIFCHDNGSYAYCYAQDSVRRSRGCTTYDANHLAQIRGMKDSSTLIIGINPQTSECSYIQATSGSYLEPKQP